ncbi:protein DYAD-like [Lycium barbarum]|uniref:protein DYAD-like n=1 Tax=Lycium barbarum TaxID=112863 RepID=UPI00293E00ED|nr:protein DYAD-like [Lycium barbarum]
METYYRKRSKRIIQANLEMDYLKGQKHTSVACADTPAMARHENQPLMPTADNDSTLKCHGDNEIVEAKMKIWIGSIYEIDHIYLPPRTPVQLKSIRVAMVSETSALNVAVRFPSMESLQTYFSNSSREMYPALDEKFVMGIALANKVLLRQVPSHEFTEKKHLHSFWLLNSTNLAVPPKHGNCLSHLKVNGMVTWGIRRQVKFLGRHEESNNTKSSSSFVQGDEISKVELPAKADKEEEEEEDNEEDQEDGVKQEKDEETEENDDEVVAEKIHRNLKRKRYSLRATTTKKAKKTRVEMQRQKNRTKKKNTCRQLTVYKDPKDRWSTERYKLAEKNLMEVMKSKGATANNPIIRPELRAEARKHIGDTGLLDHLLKHMAGKIAPGGTERFRRRHNAEGAMEYWLESADLVNIRKEAGVNDPYWIPPPGWKLGDSPTQHPICAQEFKRLKNEIMVLKRDWEEMVLSKKQLEEEVGRMKRKIEELELKKKQQESQSILTSRTMEKCKKQLMIANSDFMAKMEEKILNLVSKMEKKERSISTLMLSTERLAEVKEKQVEQESEKQGEQAVAAMERSKVAADQSKEVTATFNPKRARNSAPRAEEKAAKIQRLKSGFRLCKPQGSFLWPNMVRKNGGNNMSPQVVVQVEDLHMVQTPPSVSSSSAIAPPSLLPFHKNSLPASPVKPVPERRAVTVTVSTISSETCYGAGDNMNYSAGNKTTTMINLNDVPLNNVGEGFRQTPTSRQTITTTTTVMPHHVSIIYPGVNINKPRQASVDDSASQIQQQASKCCSSSATSLPQGAASWLVLATPRNTDSNESIIG